ncbi:MAG: type II toxin-antitoxin system VapC family toxin [Planctomycetales bacterium]
MKPTLIIDCSITMAWCFADEGDAATSEVQDRLADEAALVPPHWFLEVANVLAMAEKRQRISAADSIQFVRLLGALDIQSDDEASGRVFEHVLPLCRSQGLTSYDAAYLDLALRRQLPLASLDDDLRRAAANLGVEVLGK